jgi:hypothetical protein
VVPAGDAHDPATRQTVPEQARCLTTHTHATVSAQDEELLQVEIVGILGRGRSTHRQREADDPRTTADQEREAAPRLLPVERQPIVPEASVVVVSRANTSLRS